MEAVLATKLSDKPVLDADGETLGTVHNVTMDVKTGVLQSVTVDPNGTVDAFESTDEGRVRVPAVCIEGVDDYLVVDRHRTTERGDEGDEEPGADGSDRRR